jgi:glycosyltransferase involved in cell wall biosynthesis
MMLPVSVVIPTCDRPAALTRTIRSLLTSTGVPEEFVIVDASAGRESANAVEALFAHSGAPRLILRRAETIGAAAQRNQGVALARCAFILFCDDDIICEPDCIALLWRTIVADEGLGGVSASIINQSYVRPGAATRFVLSLIGEREGEGYAGRVVGPALAFLPRAEPGVGPHIMPVEWLNLGCTLYRRALLPTPPFDGFFSGYSVGEDLALSLRVARKARLGHVPAARILHDSQPGAHKASIAGVSRMQLINRHYLMTEVMGKRNVADRSRLFVWECFQLAASAFRDRLGRDFRQMVRGRMLGVSDLLHGRTGKAMSS